MLLNLKYNKGIQVGFNEKKEIARKLSRKAVFLTFLKKDECYKMMGEKNIHHPRKCEEAGCQEKKKVVDVGRWAADLREKRIHIHVHVQRKEKELKIRSSRTSEKTETDNDSKCDTYITRGP
jgi:hypothetical protein